MNKHHESGLALEVISSLSDCLYLDYSMTETHEYDKKTNLFELKLIEIPEKPELLTSSYLVNR